MKRSIQRRSSERLDISRRDHFLHCLLLKFLWPEFLLGLGSVLEDVLVDAFVVEPFVFEHTGIDAILATDFELNRELIVVAHLLHLPFFVS